MRILITGAGGFIGSHMVDRCKRDGHYVIAVDRKNADDWTRGEYRPDNELSGRVGDILLGAVKRVPSFGLCYHLAAESRIQPSFGDPIGHVQTNVEGTAHVLERSREERAKVIYAGSSTADSNVALNVYATTKRQGEMLCRAWRRSFKVRVDVARFYNVYGPRHVAEGRYATVVAIFERQTLAGKPLTVTGNGQQRRDFTHVDDIVDGLVAIAEKGHGDAKVYPLGTGKNYSIIELAQMFGGRIEYMPARRGEAFVTLADTSIAERALDWRARRKLQEYVAGFLESVETKV